MTELSIDQLVFDEKGLIPAIVQDVNTKEVLTLAYMNKQSLQKTLETGETWFYSRSRQTLWHKGETSGNTQKVVKMKWDCDRDAVLVLVEPNGPACHNGTDSCFVDEFYGGENQIASYAILSELEQVIAKRDEERPEGAYTTYLFEKGVDKILKKVGEEASEVIIAAKNRSHEELRWEAADLIYHLLVLLREQRLPLQDVLAVLEKRHEEKSRKNNENK
ncbi:MULTISPECIES: bifunctional phosphoribosyl-AMP cyclohydrolase/phosphoribosyl-ATP diphosphatase HisIE [Bacillus]|jgi:phosphoribosyl-ATP pyrophosphohydrolase/phosphoribosyl-AMP cyclohydrolase|uniref:bifunctional phosphoribosyl-AMP cyclohydrolase/phosphoribosyl-ATP diphosphatase HisIE n=1 Tax=Bacillus TaxID=1386 RepID=UPI00065E0C8B|nr:bifunctional phosphoribosyl-AMP cyclohydrolase/phosphoribosyl-ATP diphosphatase HisIE [Bacillus smithii]AKP45908.1 Phosphoribosyl-ATP pyrophosphatase [Bacillus smithii]MED4882638.1 bifunctional phosphoribosyl-AMP cyclohydrolase/phosphoribosyl-ATP diphosphatase HisIE [Bacillus smithii]MED4926463.1 bifunctional phosphoribosyl-AMP cyclohydrolase/phosphoribosyl-ATP diphosphatase HisIE [Bacillus smithii]